MKPRGTLLLLWLATAGCGELPLPPQVESGGEPGAPVYTAGGAFLSPARGVATYVLDAEGAAALSLSASFSIPAVPRVSVFLSNTPTLERAVKVAALDSHAGAQRWTFKVPRGAFWTHVVLWSEETSVVAAVAPLSGPR